ncbi:hypothetical protein NL108_013181 [Boleophthalmus pectinirostris]|nr:hypothetical protein NL108_013181 [Boleophthalmus pectinirostris]
MAHFTINQMSVQTEKHSEKLMSRCFHFCLTHLFRSYETLDLLLRDSGHGHWRHGHWRHGQWRHGHWRHGHWRHGHWRHGQWTWTTQSDVSLVFWRRKSRMGVRSD